MPRLLVCLPWLLAAQVVSAASPRRLLDELPIRFEPNTGQWNPQVRFCARTPGFNLFLTPRQAVLAPAGGPQVRISLLGANPAPKLEGFDPLPTRTNYFLGNRRDHWRTGLANYARVRYQQVYPGIDLVYYGNPRHLEYDYLVAPGADPTRIRIKFGGADRLSLTPDGDVLFEIGGRQLLQKKPVVYQQNRQVHASYRALGKNVVGLQLDSYDRAQPLTIDPVLVYSSFLGTTGADAVTGVKVDRAGMVYVSGYVSKGELTGTDDAFQGASAGLTDIFVAKINPALSGADSLVYLTYLGGTGLDTPTAMAVDDLGRVYLTGSTTSKDFPLAGASFQTAPNGDSEEAFVVKLNPARPGFDGLVYSTYLGGSDQDVGNAIDIDGQGAIYVIGTTRSEDFPHTDSAYQDARWGVQDTFIAKINPDADSTLVYSTYLGGELEEEGRAIAVTPSGTVYFASTTRSTQFPTTGRPLHDAPIGGIDIIIGQMDLTKSGEQSLVYSTYFGGTGQDEVRKLVVDPAGKLLLTGFTMSTDFPVTGNAFQPVLAGNADAFVTRLDLLSSLGPVLYSTYLGGAGGDVAYDITADPAGNIYVTGYTLSKDFPILGQAIEGAYNGGVEAFVTRLNPAGGLAYSTYVGGLGIHVSSAIAISPDGAIYIGGYTASPGMPITDSAYQTVYAGGLTDGFLLVVK